MEREGFYSLAGAGVFILCMCLGIGSCAWLADSVPRAQIEAARSR